MNIQIKGEFPNQDLREVRGFVVAFTLSFAAFLGMVAGIAVINRNHLPAPRLSASEAFNEKANWLANRLEKAPAPNVLVIGSSMGFCNINGAALEQALDGDSVVINSCSWGLTAQDTCAFMEELLRHVSPQLIVYPICHGDFMPGRPMDFQSADISRILTTGSAPSLYLRNLDLLYYGKTVIKQSIRRPGGRGIYDSLQVDDSGGVPLDCLNFRRSEDRWSGYAKGKLTEADFPQSQIDALVHIARLARERNAAFCVVVCPLRRVAESGYALDVREALWQRVREATEKGGGVFIRSVPVSFSDDDFVDYNHFNGCGAKKFTQAAGVIIRQHLAEQTSQSSGK